MNISLPDALREQMQPFDNKVNWSAIAATAFQRETEKQQELATIEDPVLSRLKQTEIEDTQGAEESGLKAGREWAKRHARMIHLRRLAAADDVFQQIPDISPDDLVRTMLKDPSASWVNDVPGALDYPEDFELEAGWVNSFLEGAMEIFDAVNKR